MPNLPATYAAPTGLTLRRACAADAVALSAFAAWAFEDTYGADHDASDMAAFMSRTFGAERQAGEIADPRRQILIATACGRIAGYAMSTGAPGTMVLELNRLYVHPDWKGRGLAAAMIQAVIGHARAVDAARVKLTVWDRNARAISFYKRSGFHVTGTEEFILGEETQHDIIMEMTL